MATMLEDYRHMDIRGADIKRGNKCLFGDGVLYNEFKSLTSFGEKIRYGVLHGINPYYRVRDSCCVVKDAWGLCQVVRSYNKRWDSIPDSEKRDVIASLRMLAKSGKYAVWVTKIIMLLV